MTSDSSQPVRGEPSAPPRKTWRDVADNPSAVIVFTFFGMLAFGMPLLWISRAYSWPVKILLSLLLILETAVVLTGFWWAMSWSWNRVVESLALL